MCICSAENSLLSDCGAPALQVMRMTDGQLVVNGTAGVLLASNAVCLGGIATRLQRRRIRRAACTADIR